MATEELTETQRRALSLLTDAHAHPTDDPRLGSTDPNDVVKLAHRLREVPLGGLCAMSSCSEDQVLVRRLAEEYIKGDGEPNGTSTGLSNGLRLLPCFGYHPWHSHSISLFPQSDREEHYRTLFRHSGGSEDVGKEELEALLPHLPPVRSLDEIVQEVTANLEDFDDSLLGEVGLDRAFRIPASKTSVAEQPSEQTLLSSEPQPVSSNEHTLALRGKKLTSLSTPIEHQSRILLAQIGIAVKLGKSVSMHSVRAPEATIAVLKECCRVYNGASDAAFRDINVDLHSCTLSAEVLQSLLRTHSNLYVSFSTTINSRQKNLHSQLAVVPPHRMLIESDWHTSESLARRNLDMLTIATPYLLRTQAGGPMEDQAGHVPEEELLQAAEVARRNWTRFEWNRASKDRLRAHRKRGESDRESRSVAEAESDGEGKDSDSDDEEQDKLAAFEQQWWTDVKKTMRKGRNP